MFFTDPLLLSSYLSLLLQDLIMLIALQQAALSCSTDGCILLMLSQFICIAFALGCRIGQARSLFVSVELNRLINKLFKLLNFALLRAAFQKWLLSNEGHGAVRQTIIVLCCDKIPGSEMQTHILRILLTGHSIS